MKSATPRIVLPVLLVVALLMSPVSALAVHEEDKGWKGEGELGFVDTSGNTETKSIIGRLEFRYRGLQWSHEVELSSYFSSSKGETTSERYSGAVQSNYHVTERGYVFGRGEYVDDRFAGFDYLFKEVVGYGYRVIDTKKVGLKLETGPGGRHSRTTEGDREDEVILYAAGHFLWKISKSASFTEDIRTEVGKESTQTESITALKTAINNNLSLKLSYTVRDNTDPPLGNRSTDTILAATLLFGF